MMNKNIILYAAILIFGVLAPFMLPAFKVQLSIPVSYTHLRAHET